MTSDRGAKALAERLHAIPHLEGSVDPQTDSHRVGHEVAAMSILGERGMFIADVREHEPYAIENPDHGNLPGLRCSCGWRRAVGEHYFDHIVGAP